MEFKDWVQVKEKNTINELTHKAGQEKNEC